MREEDNRLQGNLRWCLIFILFAGIIFYGGRGEEESLVVFYVAEWAALVIMGGGILIILGTVLWGLNAVRRRQRVKIPSDVARCSPPRA